MSLSAPQSHNRFSGASARGGGVWSVELDAATGMLSAGALAGGGSACRSRERFCWARDNAAFRNLANHPCVAGSGACDPKYDGENSLEASYLYNFDRVTAATGVGHTSSSSVVAAVAARPYFLFVNYYWCCRGDASTYEIRVGRAAAPTGPFYDRAGADMAEGGGTLVVGNLTLAADGHTRLVGPGHAGILWDAASRSYAFTFDFQGVTPPGGGPTQQYATQARALSWDADGWPVVSPANWFPAAAAKPSF